MNTHRMTRTGHEWIFGDHNVSPLFRFSSLYSKTITDGLAAFAPSSPAMLHTTPCSPRTTRASCELQTRALQRTPACAPCGESGSRGAGQVPGSPPLLILRKKENTKSKQLKYLTISPYFSGLIDDSLITPILSRSS
jgi:hypothetical protein